MKSFSASFEHLPVFWRWKSDLNAWQTTEVLNKKTNVTLKQSIFIENQREINKSSDDFNLNVGPHFIFFVKRNLIRFVNRISSPYAHGGTMKNASLS